MIITSSWLVFVRFLEEIKDIKKPFRNYLTFNRLSVQWIGFDFYDMPENWLWVEFCPAAIFFQILCSFQNVQTLWLKPNFSDFFNLCLHWVSAVRDFSAIYLSILCLYFVFCMCLRLFYMQSNIKKQSNLSTDVHRMK